MVIVPESSPDELHEPEHAASQKLKHLVQLPSLAMRRDQGIVCRGVGRVALIQHAFVYRHGLTRLIAHVAGNYQRVVGAQHRLHALRYICMSM